MISMITVKIDKGGQTLPPRDGADARFFGFTKMAENCWNDHKWPFDPRNAPNWTAKKYLTKHSFGFLKFIIVVVLDKKNEFHGSIATHIIWVI